VAAAFACCPREWNHSFGFVNDSPLERCLSRRTQAVLDWIGRKIIDRYVERKFRNSGV
jgi:hypothetical protein